MFGLFSKKAEISLKLPQQLISFEGAITGEITLKPLENIVLESLMIELDWVPGAFVHDAPFVRHIDLSPTPLSAGEERKIPFSIPSIKKGEVTTWYRENSIDGGSLFQPTENTRAYLDEIHRWDLCAVAQVSGDTVRSEKVRIDFFVNLI